MEPNTPQKKFDEDEFITRMRRQHGDDWNSICAASMEDAKESAQNRNSRTKKYQKRGEMCDHIIVSSCNYEGPRGCGDDSGVYSFRTKTVKIGSTKPPRTSTPNLPPILTAPPELAADLLGGLTPTTAAPKRKPAARTTKKPAKKTTAAKTRKTTKKAAKPKTKKTAATPKLTASQQEYLAIQGFVMVKRGGKYVRITG